MLPVDGIITDFSSDFKKYHNVVLGSERSRHTYIRRLNTIDELSEGIQGKRVLDLGCGYGFRTMGIAKKGADHIIGIDEDNTRIREGQLFAEQQHINNIEFTVMDAERTEFDDESFDIVIADEMIHHVKNLPGLIKEMQRILKKDGITIISDHNRQSILSELVRTLYFGRERERVFTAQEIRHHLTNAQFKDIRHKHIIMTLPFHNLPSLLMQMNYAIESIIEWTPILQLQCGVYVIRGKK
jgi:ubiquinone biosynthesis O-methyltransferase